MENRGKEIIQLFSHLWSLLLILVLILVCGIQVVTAVLISILLSLVVYHVTAAEFRQFLGAAFERKMLGNILFMTIYYNVLSLIL